MELPKSQKKVARELIQLGLQRQCRSFMKKTVKFVNDSKKIKENPHEHYLDLFKMIMTFDKYIAMRYDGLTGSYYYDTVFCLFRDGVLTEKDIKRFDVEIQKKLLAAKAEWISICKERK